MDRGSSSGLIPESGPGSDPGPKTFLTEPEVASGVLNINMKNINIKNSENSPTTKGETSPKIIDCSADLEGNYIDSGLERKRRKSIADLAEYTEIIDTEIVNTEFVENTENIENTETENTGILPEGFLSNSGDTYTAENSTYVSTVHESVQEFDNSVLSYNGSYNNESTNGSYNMEVMSVSEIQILTQNLTQKLDTTQSPLKPKILKEIPNFQNFQKFDHKIDHKFDHHIPTVLKTPWYPQYGKIVCTTTKSINEYNSNLFNNNLNSNLINNNLLHSNIQSNSNNSNFGNFNLSKSNSTILNRYNSHDKNHPKNIRNNDTNINNNSINGSGINNNYGTNMNNNNTFTPSKINTNTNITTTTALTTSTNLSTTVTTNATTNIMTNLNLIQKNSSTDSTYRQDTIAVHPIIFPKNTTALYSNDYNNNNNSNNNNSNNNKNNSNNYNNNNNNNNFNKNNNNNFNNNNNNNDNNAHTDEKISTAEKKFLDEKLINENHCPVSTEINVQKQSEYILKINKEGSETIRHSAATHKLNLSHSYKLSTHQSTRGIVRSPYGQKNGQKKSVDISSIVKIKSYPPIILKENNNSVGK